MIAEGVLAIEMAALASDVAMIHPSAPHAFGNRDGISRSILWDQHAHLPAEARLTMGLSMPDRDSDT